MKESSRPRSAGVAEEAGRPPRGEVSAWRLLEPLVSPELRPILENITVLGLAYHSNRVRPGTLFFCLSGGKVDGHKFAPVAASRGAAAVVASRPVTDCGSPQILVNDAREALSLASACFYGFPGQQLNLIGVTGTNGKTTTTYFIHSIYRTAGQPAAILGSNGLWFNRFKRNFDLTTPQSLELQESLALLREEGARVVAMEASSHALMQHRVTHCQFDSAVFTNISRDHLDYHLTIERYLKAKGRLFELLRNGPAAAAILNADDPYYSQLAGLAGDRPRILYGVHSGEAAVRAANLTVTGAGRYSFDLLGWRSPVRVSLQLPGVFNVYNALAAAAAAWKDRLSAEAVAEGLSSLAAVPGRLEEIRAEAGFTVMIDYAHTPDGLEQVLILLRQRSPRRVITVFGCPGERDRGKRPLMGRIAEQYSDLVIITADNPAGEDAATIMEEIKGGMTGIPVLIQDRREAVRHALKQAGAGDMVLLAGKGVEGYQLIGDRAVAYNERAVVNEYLESAGA